MNAPDELWPDCRMNCPVTLDSGLPGKRFSLHAHAEMALPPFLESGVAAMGFGFVYDLY